MQKVGTDMMAVLESVDEADEFFCEQLATIPTDPDAPVPQPEAPTIDTVPVA